MLLDDPICYRSREEIRLAVVHKLTEVLATHGFENTYEGAMASAWALSGEKYETKVDLYFEFDHIRMEVHSTNYASGKPITLRKVSLDHSLSRLDDFAQEMLRLALERKASLETD